MRNAVRSSPKTYPGTLLSSSELQPKSSIEPGTSETRTERPRRQRLVKHPVIPWMAATLDGIVEGTEAVFEAKFMLPWSFSEEAAAAKYMRQGQHNMWVTLVRI